MVLFGPLLRVDGPAEWIDVQTSRLGAGRSIREGASRERGTAVAKEGVGAVVG
jgi:hypothetical protein